MLVELADVAKRMPISFAFDDDNDLFLSVSLRFKWKCGANCRVPATSNQHPMQNTLITMSNNRRRYTSSSSSRLHSKNKRKQFNARADDEEWRIDEASAIVSFSVSNINYAYIRSTKVEGKRPNSWIENRERELKEWNWEKNTHKKQTKERMTEKKSIAKLIFNKDLSKLRVWA